MSATSPSINAITRQHVQQILDELHAVPRQDADAYRQQRLLAMRQLVALSPAVALPARGDTLARWQVLAEVAACDLTLVKWFEAHLDALAILVELGIEQLADLGLARRHYTRDWLAVWAAEGGDDPLRLADGRLFGKKYWCSGAALVDVALVSYRDAAGVSRLVAVDMHAEGIGVDDSNWVAVGMADTATATVTFDGVQVYPVASDWLVSPYLERAGFWHGAAGVAACWYGASVALAQVLLASYRAKPQAFKAAYLGEVSQSLTVLRAFFVELASRLDAAPQASHELAIRILRGQTEATARQVLNLLGQALGAAPFCQDAYTARLAADLAVFIRQTHGAFDAQAIGELSANGLPLDGQQDNLWRL